MRGAVVVPTSIASRKPTLGDVASVNLATVAVRILPVKVIVAPTLFIILLCFLLSILLFLLSCLLLTLCRRRGCRNGRKCLPRTLVASDAMAARRRRVIGSSTVSGGRRWWHGRTQAATHRAQVTANVPHIRATIAKPSSGDLRARLATDLNVAVGASHCSLARANGSGPLQHHIALSATARTEVHPHGVPSAAHRDLAA
mmetsp:Transcript_78800/g.168851  ORF Transcript_78800/g.168851 Transcript_78800/m.168851 type:complete len:200 (+) Transcript_78800:567-1166(+)